MDTRLLEAICGKLTAVVIVLTDIGNLMLFYVGFSLFPEHKWWVAGVCLINVLCGHWFVRKRLSEIDTYASRPDDPILEPDL